MVRLPVGVSVCFALDRPVASLKNRREWKKVRYSMKLVPSKQCRADMDMIAYRAAEAARGKRFHALDILELKISHDVDDESVVVTVTKIGEYPERGKRGTQRDCHGMIETVADALQGVLYSDDSQIDRGSWGRTRQACWTPLEDGGGSVV